MLWVSSGPRHRGGGCHPSPRDGPSPRVREDEKGHQGLYRWARWVTEGRWSHPSGLESRVSLDALRAGGEGPWSLKHSTEWWMSSETRWG